MCLHPVFPSDDTVQSHRILPNPQTDVGITRRTYSHFWDFHNLLLCVCHSNFATCWFVWPSLPPPRVPVWRHHAHLHRVATRTFPRLYSGKFYSLFYSVILRMSFNVSMSDFVIGFIPQCTLLCIQQLVQAVCILIIMLVFSLVGLYSMILVCIWLALIYSSSNIWAASGWSGVLFHCVFFPEHSWCFAVECTWFRVWFLFSVFCTVIIRWFVNFHQLNICIII